MMEIFAGVVGGICAVISFIITVVILEEFKYGWVFVIAAIALLIWVLIRLS